MKQLFAVGLLIALAGCATTPAEQEYCASYGVLPGQPEYANCTNYFFQQTAAFHADAQACSAQADVTYPKSLYSRPYSYIERGYGIGSYGFGSGAYRYSGGFARPEIVYVGADYQQIAEVDRLRMTIIAPCMQHRGWASPTDWRAGRLAPAKVVVPTPLPWGK